MKRAWSVVAVAILVLSPTLVTTNHAHAAAYNGVGVTTNNLFMYFDAGNYSGYTYPTLTDLSGNGYNFTAQYAGTGNYPTFNWANGNYLSFPGNGNANGGYLNLNSFSTGPSDWSGLSVSMYVNIGATYSDVERVFDFGNGNPTDNFWAGTGNYGAMAMEVFNGSASNGWCRSLDNAATTNTWIHWTFTFDGTNCKVYKNNVLNNTVSYTYRPKANITMYRNYIGKSNWSADPYFEGSIADLAIYKGVLSDSERTQNYNAQTDITPPSYTGPSSFNVNEGQTAVGSLTSEAGATFFLQNGSLDNAKFSLSLGGTLAFSGFTPDYETPLSVNNNNTYTSYFKIMDANGNVTNGTTVTVPIQERCSGNGHCHSLDCGKYCWQSLLFR
jgi:hypothetical protein